MKIIRMSLEILKKIVEYSIYASGGFFLLSCILLFSSLIFLNASSFLVAIKMFFISGVVSIFFILIFATLDLAIMYFKKIENEDY